jgi:hypothetical protein
MLACLLTVQGCFDVIAIAGLLVLFFACQCWLGVSLLVRSLDSGKAAAGACFSRSVESV